MKKLFLFAAAAAMFVACSQTEEQLSLNDSKAAKPETIDFSVYLNKTRAGLAKEITTDILKTSTDGFGVLAYYTDDREYDQDAIPNFMYNQQITWKNNKWTYEPVKYWPNEFGADATSEEVDRVTFFAYAPWVPVIPSTGAVNTGSDGLNIAVTALDEIEQAQSKNITAITKNSATGDPLVKYVVDVVPATSVDLLWAVSGESSEYKSDGTNKKTTTTVVKGLPFIDMAKPASDYKVSFHFRHALSKLNIQIDTKVKNQQDPDNLKAEETKIWVRSITIDGLALNGALNLNNTVADKPNWYNYNGADELVSDRITIYDGRKDGKEGVATVVPTNEKPTGLNPLFVQDEKATITNNAWDDVDTRPGVTAEPVNLFYANGATDPIYVIPTSDPVTITIVYDVETIDKNLPTLLADGVTHGSAIQNKITKTGVFNNLEAGKAYTIKLHLGITNVEFDADVQGWDATTEPAEPDLPSNW